MARILIAEDDPNTRQGLAKILQNEGYETLVADNGGSAVDLFRREKPDAERVLQYIREHPGSRSEDIYGHLGTDAASLRPVLHRLRDEGKVKVEGKARAMRYLAEK